MTKKFPNTIEQIKTVLKAFPEARVRTIICDVDEYHISELKELAKELQSQGITGGVIKRQRKEKTPKSDMGHYE